MPSRLADDVLFDILEIAFYSPSANSKDVTRIPTCPQFRHIGTPYPKGLKSASLVCRQWSSFSQSILFRRVELVGRAQVLAFAAALRSGIFLGDAVQAMKIVLEETAATNPRESNDEDLELADEVAVILASCRRLYELRLSLTHLPPFSQDAFELLRQSALPITLLDVHNKARSKNTHWTVVGQLLECLPSLNYLFISGETPATQCQKIHPKFKLSSLMWDNWTPAEQGAIEMLLQESVGKLKSLSIRFAPDMHSFRELMLTHGSSLKELSLWHSSDSQMDEIAMAISFQPPEDADVSPPRQSLVPTLESFHTVSVPSEALLGALPPSVTSLHFASSFLAPPVPLQPVLQWIPKQEKLKKVSYRFNGDRRLADVQLLESTCHERKVELEWLSWW